MEAPFVFFAHLDKEAVVAGTEHRRNMLVVIYDQDFWGRNREEEEEEEKRMFFISHCHNYFKINCSRHLQKKNFPYFWILFDHELKHFSPWLSFSLSGPTKRPQMIFQNSWFFFKKKIKMAKKKFFLALFRVLCFLSHFELLFESRDVQESLKFLFGSFELASLKLLITRTRASMDQTYFIFTLLRQRYLFYSWIHTSNFGCSASLSSSAKFLSWFVGKNKRVD